jgi:hypothetical protein
MATKWLHGRAVQAFPRFADMEPQEFVQLLSAGEIALGTSLLGIGLVPSGLAGLALGVFGGSLVLDSVFGSRGRRRKKKKP